MEDYTRRKNGQWKCKYGNWHDKGEKCNCEFYNLTDEEKARLSRGF
jgi:hypothetical protein